jgi:peroxiredoxin Q/BCP
MIGASAGEPLAAGTPAPDFELDGTGGVRVRLASLLAEGPVALFFYPGDFTPG